MTSVTTRRTINDDNNGEKATTIVFIVKVRDYASEEDDGDSGFAKILSRAQITVEGVSKSLLTANYRGIKEN